MCKTCFDAPCSPRPLFGQPAAQTHATNPPWPRQGLYRPNRRPNPPATASNHCKRAARRAFVRSAPAALAFDPRKTAARTAFCRRCRRRAASSRSAANSCATAVSSGSLSTNLRHRAAECQRKCGGRAKRAQSAALPPEVQGAFETRPRARRGDSLC